MGGKGLQFVVVKNLVNISHDDKEKTFFEITAKNWIFLIFKYSVRMKKIQNFCSGICVIEFQSS